MADTARYIEAPKTWNGEGASVFLAGGITGCPDWQQQAQRLLADLDVTVINPRRADFPIGDPTAAPAQIAWEFDHLHRATAILFWFPASEGPQPIALYELGRYLALGRPLAVGCDPAYPRRQDVIEQVGLAAHDMPVWGNLSATCIAAGAAVASAYRAGQAATPDGPRTWALPDGAEVEEQWTMRYVLNGRWQTAEDGGHVFDSREQATRHLEAWRIHFPTLTYTNVEYLRRQVITMPWELTDATPAADGQDGDGRDG